MNPEILSDAAKAADAANYIAQRLDTLSEEYRARLAWRADAAMAA